MKSKAEGQTAERMTELYGREDGHARPTQAPNSQAQRNPPNAQVRQPSAPKLHLASPRKNPAQNRKVACLLRAPTLRVDRALVRRLCLSLMDDVVVARTFLHQSALGTDSIHLSVEATSLASAQGLLVGDRRSTRSETCQSGVVVGAALEVLVEMDALDRIQLSPRPDTYRQRACTLAEVLLDCSRPPMSLNPAQLQGLQPTVDRSVEN